MARNIISRERLRSIVIFLIWGTGLLAFAAFAIYPRYQLAKETDSRIREIKAQIAGQKELLPLLVTRLPEADKFRLPEGLSVPKKSPLGSEEKGKLFSDIEQLAARNHLVAEGIVPGTGSEAIVIFLVTPKIGEDDKTGFGDIHRFLLGVGELGYVDRIDRIAIRAADQVRKIELKLRLVGK